MGYWSEVDACMRYGGMRRHIAEQVVAASRYGTEEEKAEAEKLEAIERANRVIDTMP